MTVSRRHLFRFGLGAAGLGVLLMFVIGAALSPVSSADLSGGPATADHSNLIAYQTSGHASSPSHTGQTTAGSSSGRRASVAATRTRRAAQAAGATGTGTTVPTGPAVTASRSTHASSTPAAETLTSSQTALMNMTAPPAPFPNEGYGCQAALAYLSLYANPAFGFECPGWAQGHQAMTCENIPSVCSGQYVIVIAVPCPAAYENEAWNSWHIYTGPIDPYGGCTE